MILKAPRERAAVEVEEKDHVVGRGDRQAAELEIGETAQPRPRDPHVGIDGNDAMIALRQDAIEKEARSTARENRPLGRNP